MKEAASRPAAAGSHAGASGSSPARFAILGEPRLYRHGLALLLKDYAPDLDIRDAGETGLAGLSVQAGLLILPADPDRALSLVTRATASMSRTPLLAHTLFAEPGSWARMMNSGLRGIVGPDAELEMLLAALRLVAAGGAYVPPELITQTLVPGTATAVHPWSARQYKLTEREQAILSFIGRSLSNQEIASELGIAQATVRVHLRNLRQKLEARSRVDLALLATKMRD